MATLQIHATAITGVALEIWMQNVNQGSTSKVAEITTTGTQTVTFNPVNQRLIIQER